MSSLCIRVRLGSALGTCSWGWLLASEWLIMGSKQSLGLLSEKSNPTNQRWKGKGLLEGPKSSLWLQLGHEEGILVKTWLFFFQVLQF